MRHDVGAGVLLVTLSALAACAPTDPPGGGDAPPARSRAAAGGCASRDPLRQAFFGDLHVHTAWSMDARSFGATATPDDAYRFAQGASLSLAGGALARLERPLDFAAVSEHAEFIGEVALCSDPESEVHEHERCRRFRDGALGDGARMSALTDARGPYVETAEYGRFGWRVRAPDLCGEDGARCRDAAADVWGRLQAAAARWNDESEECRFTTFNAYEWSWSPQLSKVHRNVIFRNDVVPQLPHSAIEYDEPDALFRALERDCRQAGTGCDVLTIPHNPNLSDGRLLGIDFADLPPSEARARAERRAALEPLVEIMQIKGDSECRNGFPDVLGGPDELCEFEKLRPPDLPLCGRGTGFGSIGGMGCTKPVDYVRYALVEGLRQAERLGRNPLKLGIVASTDTHDANPGDTEEFSFQGWQGRHTATPGQRLRAGAGSSAPLRTSPGGLVGVWAEENSREALFAAMQRRETFGTSGTRIRPRLFGSWELDLALCGWPDHVARADAVAVPMGADLPPRPQQAGAPFFLASALRDPGSPLHPGQALERIQIVKGWVGPGDTYRQAVYDVAVAETSASVDPDSCEVSPGGRPALCAVWRDPDFDASRRAVYYARVVEVPSCRWNAWECLRLREDARPPGCSDPAIPRIVSERAWTSPIWYTPTSERASPEAP